MAVCHGMWTTEMTIGQLRNIFRRSPPKVRPPVRLSHLIGLSREKRKARLGIRACFNSGEVFSHTLLYGIGGTGKTVFARAVGNELGYHFIETHGDAFTQSQQLFEAIVHFSDQAARQGKTLLLFLDEIHQLKIPLQEALYSVMKEWWIPTAREPIRVPPFTLIGATTRFDLLDANSFVTRFLNVWEIERYNEKDISTIVAYEFDKMGLKYNRVVLRDIAGRALGIPRIAVTLAEKIKLTVRSKGGFAVTPADCRETFDLEQIDEMGFHPVHRRYLQILGGSFTNGGFRPLGVGSIAAKMRQHEDAVKGSIEPILMEFDLVAATPRGRILTQQGANYLKKAGKFS